MPFRTPAYRASRLRLMVVALIGCLGTLSFVTFLRWGTSPSDENLFTDPPSAVYVDAPIAAAPTAGGSPAPGRSAGAVAAGDLILAIGDVQIRQVADVPHALEGASGSADVGIKVYRPSTRDRLLVRVPAGEIERASLRDIARAVVVVDVTPGGASDRAGLRVGDVIVRINGQTFASAIQADGIMRQAAVGHATAYDVLRGGQPLTLHVTLASFGFQIGLLATVLTGALWMGFGAALALARPRIQAALFLGLGFITIGYALSVAFIRPADQTALAFVRDVVLVTCVYFGFAFFAHANRYFPRERPQLLARRWALPLIYAVATGATVLSIWRLGNLAFVVGLGLTLLVSQAIAWGAARDRTPDERQILQVIRWATFAAAGAAWTLFVVAVLRGGAIGSRLPLLVTVLAALPLAYAYTIVRYRLLDLDIRVRRNVQYSVASAAWGLGSVLVFLWLLTLLPRVHVPLPNVRVTGSSLELLDAPLTAEERAPLEMAALMLVAIGLAFGFRAMGRRGQRWIATRFHRTAYDYRRASQALAEVMSTRLDLDGLADGLMDTLVQLMPLKRAGVVFVNGARSYCGVRARGFEAEAWTTFCAVSAADVVQGAAKATSEVDADYVFPRLRRALDAAKIHYLYPIRAHQRLVGVVLVGEKRSEAAFEDDDFQFLGAVAQQVSAGVENAFLYEQLAEQERLKHELEIARRIQLESLPQFTPIVDGLEIAGASIPAFEVGGDYYDYLDGTPPRFTVMVGDVSGKGTSAALYMSKLQGILRSLHGFDLTPHDLFVRTNQLLCHDLERRSFVTALGGFFDTARRHMTLARAGHLPLYHFDRALDRVHRVLPRGLGFGLSHRHIFADELEERDIAYASGDVFLFITDGITECLSAAGDDFGEERVMRLLGDLASSGATAAAIRDRLLLDVREFAANVEQFDDQTVVVVRATG